MSPREEKAASAFAPFRHRAFAVLWVATVVSNIGTWMNDVGNGWLMTTLDPTPSMVALVQAATTLPILLFALLAGAIADIVDRRRLLIVLNVALGLLAAGFSALVAGGLAGVGAVLAYAFLAGTAAAFMAPAWQAIVPRLVSRAELTDAVALNGMGINVSRAIGPALGGLLIVSLGIAAPYVVNAASFLGIIAALVFWKPEPGPARRLPAERVGGAIGAGLRYARRSAPLKATLVRSLAFFVCASAFWALLPLVVRQELGGDAGLYGILLGCVGAGAVGGAFLLPVLRRRLDANRLVAAGTLGIAAVMAVFALVPHPMAAGAAGMAAGLCWICVMANLNASGQTAVPDWVRARGLSLLLMVFAGSMAAGSMGWGYLADHIGIPATLLAAAGLAVLLVPLVGRWRLAQGADLDLTPSLHWPAPPTAIAPEHDRGPVLITVSYVIAAEDTDAFLDALRLFAHERRRDGAYRWQVFEDTEQPGHWTETFLVASWLEHLRQHERVTEADRATQAIVHRFHRGDGPPVVRHFLAPSGR